MCNGAVVLLCIGCCTQTQRPLRSSCVFLSTETSSKKWNLANGFEKFSTRKLVSILTICLPFFLHAYQYHITLTTARSMLNVLLQRCYLIHTLRERHRKWIGYMLRGDSLPRTVIKGNWRRCGQE